MVCELVCLSTSQGDLVHAVGALVSLGGEWKFLDGYMKRWSPSGSLWFRSTTAIKTLYNCIWTFSRGWKFGAQSFGDVGAMSPNTVIRSVLEAIRFRNTQNVASQMSNLKMEACCFVNSLHVDVFFWKNWCTSVSLCFSGKGYFYLWRG